ncbi:TIR domain-containing protein [Vibrio crassostreae]|uniref:toll/interleukin-1 receptor domain-containing protein n=1 Tax=Vibrio crassostreae TaxID=246167 RepID=UPI000F4F4F5D|nr:toll/interleukin-1 receptor domain-containing protein [Vibrio crassostreae]RPF50716.1 TIR domain-containing protein [Vibrio crassostreae]CAK2832360.1 TIR domain-containing protein [Vibrio crassostreae]CAK2832379.1 TIR domain-containing protein [Vibrio crassostreae]CAK2837298.1 TIR domain-containing protein [Vibrio crassostreae]CAK2839046.1 TIR domain-containing protein [Vibrio crassostreae]
MNIFLSYSHEDSEVVDKVRNFLDSHEIAVFNDKTDIGAGESLTVSINQAISNSDAVLFFVSKNSEKSQWIQQEMSLAVSDKLKGRDIKLIPVLLDRGVEVPFFLRDYLYLDMSNPADFESTMTRLISGLNETSKSTAKQDLEAKAINIEIEKELLQLKTLEYEELQKYKTRQMFFVSAIVTLISAIFVSVGLLSWLTESENSNLEWILAFVSGSVASLVGSFLYMKKEAPNKQELNKKVNEIYDLVKSMEERNVR